MKTPALERSFASDTGKIHTRCPHSDRTGIKVHVVIRDGYCYRSNDCMVIWCKYNSIQTDLDSFLSIIW